MTKDYSQAKLLSMEPEKQLRILFKLADYIENEKASFDSNHFEKLKKYHDFLCDSDNQHIQKINKEFAKVKALDYQFQVYLMNLERFLGQSKKEYDFLVNTGDNSQAQRKFPITCILDSVRSAHNVGSFFRNAECFGVSELILAGLTPTPELAQVKKTSMGCDENLDWRFIKDAKSEIKKLKKDGHTIWSIETSRHATHINEIKEAPQKLVLIFGHEQHGISAELLELSDLIVDITLFGAKNSLNVSVSQAIVLNRIVQFFN
ncbi:MAG: 23S rRNA (guanosine2251-2'-O)-methyltransferase [Thermoproteota archaeon]|jgi:23S rRNA (guanosine2251-2'-O)-methyltransferase